MKFPKHDSKNEQTMLLIAAPRCAATETLKYPPSVNVYGTASMVTVATADLPSKTRNGGGNESELETPEGSRGDTDRCWPPKLILYNRNTSHRCSSQGKYLLMFFQVHSNY